MERRHLLLKRGLYYRPDSCGYTGIKQRAGRYLESDAHPESGVTAVHEDEAPDYAPGCFDDVAREHMAVRISALRSALGRLAASNESQAECLERYAEQHGHEAKPVPSVFHLQASHFRDFAREARQALREDGNGAT